MWQRHIYSVASPFDFSRSLLIVRAKHLVPLTQVKRVANLKVISEAVGIHVRLKS